MMRSLLSRQDHLQQITVWREFNRFYTARLGLLRARYLDSEFSLTESRILYELLLDPGRTATALRKTLGLDAGYISRLLLSLSKQGLVQQTSSPADSREKLLKLSAKGRDVAQQLDQHAGEDISNMLRSLDASRRKMLVASLARVHEILRNPLSNIEIVQASLKNLAAVRSLLSEYYDALNVVQRDTPTDVRKLLSEPNAGFWIAYVGATPAGCVVLRPLSAQRLAGECKRLYVRPAFRGNGIAKALLDRLETFAVSRGLMWIYLDSKDDLHAAIQLYRQRGYRMCKRYNDNPQATLFLRKKIGKSPKLTIAQSD
jgi:DNA-binding MarR family transcriptional regulator/GNAT superfamily N-acetyltransferase